jgi:hypothetical protein
MLVKLGVDFENGAELWWESGGRELWASIAEESDASSTVVDDSIARSWITQAEAIPGWFDGPDYAPHPIRLAQVEDDDVPV